MVLWLAWSHLSDLSVVDYGFELCSVKTMTIELVFVASPLSTQHSGVRAKIDCLRIWIIYLSGVTCPSSDCCFSELALEIQLNVLVYYKADTSLYRM